MKKDMIYYKCEKPGHYVQDVVSYELVDITAEVDGQKIPIEAAVADKLPVQVLLGSDLPLEKLIVRRISKESFAECSKLKVEEAFAVMTRSQSRKNANLKSSICEKRKQLRELQIF